MSTKDGFQALTYVVIMSAAVGYSVALGEWLANNTLPKQNSFITEVTLVVHKDGGLLETEEGE